MSDKRKKLGFDDESSEEDISEVKTAHKRKLKLPKLAFNMQSNDAEDDRGSVKEPEIEEDQNEDDYLGMTITEDEWSKPQRLKLKDEKAPTSYSFETIQDKHLKKSTHELMKTSLFGQISSSSAQLDGNQIISTLPNDQPKTKSKGLSIMEKMGFKIGETLGKNTQSTSALLEPIITVPRTNKVGLGRAADDIARYDETESKGITVEDTVNFRNRLNEEQNEERLTKIYHKMQKYCFELSGDAELGDIEKLDPLDINVMWRSYVLFVQKLLKEKKVKQQGNEGEATVEELEVEGEEEAEKKEEKDEEEEKEEDGDDDEELKFFEDMKIRDKVERLSLHLRTEYNYCFYCGARFEDQADLYEHCPGSTEEDHN